MAEHSVVRGAIARTPASKTLLWQQGIPVMLRIDANRKVTSDTHDVISSFIRNVTNKIKFVTGQTSRYLPLASTYPGFSSRTTFSLKSTELRLGGFHFKMSSHRPPEYF